MGSNLRELRFARGFASASALDKAAGVPRGQTAKIERGDKKGGVSLDTITRLCVALGCKVDDLGYEPTGTA